MRKKHSILVILAAALYVLAGCAGSYEPISYESLGLQLETPTGVVDAATLSSAMVNFQAQNSMPETRGAFVSLPQPLRGPLEVSPVVMLERAGVPAPVLDLLTPGSLSEATPASRGGLVARQSAGQLKCITGDTKASTARYTVDLGCMGASGTIRIESRGITPLVGSMPKHPFEGEARMTFAGVCSKGQCIHGALHAKLKLTTDRSESSSMYHLKVERQGQATQTIKGGVRVVIERGKDPQVSMLVYATDGAGKEVSLVFEMANTSKSSRFTLRGQNGVFSCQSNPSGGSCQSQTDASAKAITWKLP